MHYEDKVNCAACGRNVDLAKLVCEHKFCQFKPGVDTVAERAVFQPAPVSLSTPILQPSVLSTPSCAPSRGDQRLERQLKLVAGLLGAILLLFVAIVTLQGITLWRVWH